MPYNVTQSSDEMKCNPDLPGGSLKSKPTWSNPFGCFTTSAFFVLDDMRRSEAAVHPLHGHFDGTDPKAISKIIAYSLRRTEHWTHRINKESWRVSRKWRPKSWERERMRSIWILPIGWLIASTCLGRLPRNMGPVVVTERRDPFQVTFGGIRT